MGIRYEEKGVGMHAAIAAAGHHLGNHDGAWVSSDDAAVQVIIDSYPLSAVHTEIVSRIDVYATALRDRITTGISAAEMAAWPIKRAEATAYIGSGNPADAPMLAAEASARGVPLGDIVARVRANAERLAGVEACIAGVAGRHKDAVRTTATFAAALGYDWSGGWPEP